VHAWDMTSLRLRERTRGSLRPWAREGVEVVEAAQPIHANLIQFPRELVATRKIRPRPRGRSVRRVRWRRRAN